MNSSVSPANGASLPSSPAAVSSKRSAVRADGDDAPARGAQPIERLRRCLADFTPFGVHAMASRIVRLHRQEGAGTHVQGEEVPGNAARIERGKQRLREMQARGRCRYRPGVARINGLMALRIFGHLLATVGDVWGQRRITERLDRFVEIGAVQTEGKVRTSPPAPKAAMVASS